MNHFHGGGISAVLSCFQKHSILYATMLSLEHMKICSEEKINNIKIMAIGQIMI